MAEPVLLVVSVDTEEDNWVPSREKITVANINELRRFGLELGRIGARATYFATYHVATTPWCAEILNELAAGDRAEIGAHLHPWNTPPVELELTSSSTYVCNLPQAVQRAKIDALTKALSGALGRRPYSFRAGRWGFTQSTALALLECGYRVDSSVTPFKSWRSIDGPSHVGAPTEVYRIDGRGDHRIPVLGGPLVEVPISLGYAQVFWSLVQRMNLILDGPSLNRRAFEAIARRLHLLNHVILNPEMEPVEHMETLARRLLERGTRHLHIALHSSSLLPGCNPYGRTRADVEQLYTRLLDLVDRVQKLTPVRFATVEEAAALIGGVSSAPREPL